MRKIWLDPRPALLLLLLALAAPTFAQVAFEGGDTLNLLSFTSQRLEADRAVEPLSEGKAAAGAEAAQLAWSAFRAKAAGAWVAEVDRRTGSVDYAEGAGLPWVPGAGNALSLSDVGALKSAAGGVDLATLDSLARQFLRENAALLGVAGETLQLNLGRSGQPGPHLWFVDYDVVRNGIAIEGARVVFRVNNGNLIQLGSENLPSPGSPTPAIRIGQDQAWKIVNDFLGGFFNDDLVVDAGSLRLLPVEIADAKAAEGFALGQGRGLVAVWRLVFRRPGVIGTWQARVDATSGEVLDFFDINDYVKARVSGGAYALDRPAAERVLAMPWANVATGIYADSAGNYDWTGGTFTTTLNGKYVRISDSCGSISKSSDGTGAIALGTSSGTDCTTPGSGGAGNTHAARTQFYAVNRAKEIGRGWLPSNTWLAGQLTVNVNLNQTCNAYWNGSSINFFRSGGGCANTGELPGVSLHEYGHGLDSNDGNSSSPDNGTGETYGDFTAALFTHQSCIGNGFLGSNCGGYGNACTSCTGVRDIDWAKHSANTPSTVANFTQAKCPNPSPSNPNYKGPCGKEGHCESLVSSEALWDLANRDLPNPGSGSAWAIADRLWFLSRSTATKAFNCVTTTSPWSANGCSTGSLFRVLRAVDDDNGNLADGTPNGGAIAAAFNRHGIACTTDTAWNVSFRACTPPAAPALSLTAGDNQVTASWSGSSGVYDLYRNETGCNAGFIKAANDLSGSSTIDGAVANGVTYYYQVVAQPSGNEACASAPSTCQSVTPTAPACTPPAAPTGLTATAASATQINLSWSAVAGATYRVYRSTTSGGPYSLVGSPSTTTYSDSGLTCNTTYFYVVRAYTSCESGNSTQAQATTSACTGNVLQNGVPVTGLSGATGSEQTWTMAVPSGASNLKFQISGGTGDADLYVRFGSPPTTATYDCRPYLSGNSETCTFATPQVGTYYVMLRGYAAYSGVTLTGSYSTGSTCTAVAESETNDSTSTADPLTAPCSTVAGTFVGESGSNDYFSMSLPAGATVTALLNGLSVDYDLYLYRAGSTTAVASSTNGGTTADQASWTNSGTTAVTIYARVYKYATTRTTYALRVSY